MIINQSIILVAKLSILINANNTNKLNSHVPCEATVLMYFDLKSPCKHTRNLLLWFFNEYTLFQSYLDKVIIRQMSEIK